MRIDWISSGFEEILRGPGVQQMVNIETAYRASLAGRGYRGSTQQGATRYRGIVYPDNGTARRDNAANNTLLRVIG